MPLEGKGPRMNNVQLFTAPILDGIGIREYKDMVIE